MSSRFLVPCCDFSVKLWFVYTPICFLEGSCFIFVICIYFLLLVFNAITILYSFRFTVKRRLSLVGQELVTLPEHLSSVRDFSELRVAQSLVFCMWFIVDHCLSFCVFLLCSHCIVCLSSIEGFRMSVWYRQTFMC